MSRFKNMKFDVSASEELNIAVQKKLFELGYRWCFTDQCRVQNSEQNYLFSSEKGLVEHCGNNTTFFEDDACKQVNLNKFFAMKKEPEPEAKEMTIAEISEKLGYEVKVVKG